MTRLAVSLVVSLDVEEEGLFGGRYASFAPPVTNTSCLARLVPLLDLGVRPTFFCAHSVLADPAARADIGAFMDKFGNMVEFGAHLHYWNTPPVAGDMPKFVTSAPTSGVPTDILAAKLETLLEEGRNFYGVRPTSFRMGRWDIHREHWALLACAGITCDASVRPLHSTLWGPNHFSAPTAPYRVPAGGDGIFEVPLTVTPLVRLLPRLLERLPEKSGLGSLSRAGLKNWGALALLPACHPLWLMRLVTRLFVSRGGRVLSLTWHSSEMMPGGAPHVPDATAVDALLNKIYHYAKWLYRSFAVHSCTMRELTDDLGRLSPKLSAPTGDWTSE